MKQRTTLKMTLMVSFLVIAALPVIMIGWIGVQTLSHRMEAEIFENHYVISRAMAGEIERFLDQPVGILNQIIEVFHSRRLIRQNDIGEYLDAVFKSYPHFVGLQIVDNKGVVIHNAPYDPDYIGIDLSRRPFFRHFLDKKNSGAGSFWSPAFISLQAGFTTLTLSCPFDKGVVAGKLNLSHLKSISDRVKIGHTGFSAVFDKDGTIIAHPDPSKVSQQVNFKDVYAVYKGLEGEYGAYHYDYKGQSWVGSVSGVEQTGWVVGLFQPAEEAFASVRQIRNLIISGAGLSIFCAMFVAFGIVGKIMTPLSMLIRNTTHVKEGDYSQFDMPDSYREINELAFHFRLMTEAVESRERKIRASEADLKSEKEFTDAAINSLTDTFFVYVPESGSAVRWNDAFRKMTGYADEDISAMKAPESFYAPEHREKFTGLNETILKNSGATIEIDLITKDGRTIPTEYSASAIKGDKGNIKYIISVGRDITERKRLESQLQYAKKMEAVGTIAGGIAHEFNNILGIILGNAELAVDDIPANNPVRHNLDEIIEAGMRAKKAVHELLDFNPRSRGQKVVTEISSVIEESIESLKPSLPESIDIRYAVLNPPGPIHAQRAQIRQIIANICSNAVHAMEEKGGVLNVTVDDIHLKEDLLIDHLQIKSGRYSEITISDTGCGIRPEIMPRIFDPYFTTKDVGKGSGMGLSIVHGIVKKYGGIIHVQSNPPEGTQVKVLFPAVEAPASET